MEGWGLEMTEPPKPTLVDSHSHIDMPQFDADRDAVVARAREAGVANMLIAGGVDAEDGHRRALRVAEEFGLPVSAGVHPHEAKLANEAIYDELRGLARDGRIVAIDAYWCQQQLYRRLGVKRFDQIAIV